MATLVRAIEISAGAHAGQVGNGGKPYIMHPFRVMQLVAFSQERMAAVLHDVVEDTRVSLQGLISEGFPYDVVSAIEALTKRPGESWIHATERAAANAIARQVKLADNAENMDLSGIPPPSQRDYARVEEYKAVR